MTRAATIDIPLEPSALDREWTSMFFPVDLQAPVLSRFRDCRSIPTSPSGSTSRTANALSQLRHEISIGRQ